MINFDNKLIESVIDISNEAGNAIMEIYHKNEEIIMETKSDASPLTMADLASHKIIKENLGKLTPDIPLISEEGSNIPFSKRSFWEEYWLIDPLDGTKEFLKRNGEFTVNIALIKNNRPEFGLIFVPNDKTTFWGSREHGSHKINCKNISSEMRVSKSSNKTLRLVCSRSHLSKELTSVIEKIDNCQTVSIGSSLKFCLIANGDADCYPRFGPTSEWDTAAGEIIASSAGATVVDLNNNELKYNDKEDYLNPSFVVSNSNEISNRILSLI